MGEATAVTVFHPVDDPAGFGRWSQDLLASAQAAAGHVAGRLSVHPDAALDCAVAVTFSDELQLHRWLDSAERGDVLGDGRTRGYSTCSADMILTEDGPLSAGVGLFRHAVAAGMEADFEAMEVRLAVAAADFPGYEGTVLLAPDRRGEWISMARFRTSAQLSEWMHSVVRAEALSGLRSTLRREFTTASSTTPFATTVRIEGGRTLMTPNWKSAMLVLLVLYPTVMLLSRFLGPVIADAGAAPWLGLWISQIISVVAMQWWLMPAASRPFRRWLDPLEGKGFRIGFVGAAAIIVLYAVTLMVFATVHELHFWDYVD
ncbi:MAG: antibiotic biosynthesis monooxygenase [Mycobacterium sp.]